MLLSSFLFLGLLPPLAPQAVTEIAAEICVIDATPAGISAAIAAARLGSDVLLIERTSHIGGLPANGLGVTDISTRETIRGIFHEFISAVRQHYVDRYGEDSQQGKDSSDGYHFEPHVAEEIFERMLKAEPRIRLLRMHQFEGYANVREGRVDVIQVRNRENNQLLQVRAKVFIDATYEGDVAAAAKVPYRIGREGRDETGEPYAGVFYQYFGTKEIYPDPRTGQGDHRIQAYNYPLCLTNRPELRIYPAKPATYNREDYAALVDDIREKRVTRFGRSPNDTAGVFNIVPVPNGKSDTNNHHNGLISTDLPEENQEWPEETWKWREKFSQRLRDYTLGLLWFTQNDPELPDWFREQAR